MKLKAYNRINILKTNTNGCPKQEDFQNVQGKEKRW
jgi:hypothetical protein